jgi:DNA-binding GntR family transcriptional regulator
MPIEKIKFLTVKETVYRKLVKEIISGEIAPGTPLIAQELADQFGVSLMPIRESLRKLEAGGFVVPQKNRRLVVRELSVKDLREILRIRLDLELMAAREAVKNITEDEINRLEELMDEIKTAENPEEFLKENYEFHHTIYEAAKMPILKELIRELWMRVSPYFHIYTASTPDYRVLKIHYHEGILEGLRKKDEEEVCSYLAQDLEKAAELVSGVLADRNLTELLEIDKD